MSQLKTCFKCGLTQPVDNFYKHPAMTDGRLGKCKDCAKTDTRKNYHARIDYYREYDRKRAMAPHRVEARKKYTETLSGKNAIAKASRKYSKKESSRIAKKMYIKRNPIKRAAHIACGNAIRDGRLIKAPCEICGENKAQAHHDDYGKPLEVRWLCTKHHAEWHKNNTPICPEQNTSDAYPNIPLAQDRPPADRG